MERNAQLPLSASPTIEEKRNVIQQWIMNIGKFSVDGKQVSKPELAKMLNLSMPTFLKEMREIYRCRGMMVDEISILEAAFDWISDNKLEFKRKLEKLNKQEALGLQSFYQIMELRNSCISSGSKMQETHVDLTLLRESTKLIDNANKNFVALMNSSSQILDSLIKLTGDKDGNHREVGITQIVIQNVGQVYDAIEESNRRELKKPI